MVTYAPSATHPGDAPRRRVEEAGDLHLVYGGPVQGPVQRVCVVGQPEPPAVLIRDSITQGVVTQGQDNGIARRCHRGACNRFRLRYVCHVVRRAPDRVFLFVLLQHSTAKVEPQPGAPPVTLDLNNTVGLLVALASHQALEAADGHAEAHQVFTDQVVFLVGIGPVGGKVPVEKPPLVDVVDESDLEQTVSGQVRLEQAASGGESAVCHDPGSRRLARLGVEAGRTASRAVSAHLSFGGPMDVGGPGGPVKVPVEVVRYLYFHQGSLQPQYPMLRCTSPDNALSFSMTRVLLHQNAVKHPIAPTGLRVDVAS